MSECAKIAKVRCYKGGKYEHFQMQPMNRKVHNLTIVASHKKWATSFFFKNCPIPRENWSRCIFPKQSVTFRFGNFFDGIGIGFENFWYRKKYWYRVLKKFGIGKCISIGFVNFWYRKKSRYRFLKKNGIEKYFLFINWFC